MPLMRLSEILRESKSKKSCVAAFNCHNFESIKTVIEAGEKLASPVIVMLYPAFISHIPLTTFAAITRDLAEKSEYPVGLHLDHCEDFDLIMAAVKAGFQSVIVDASRHEYEKNTALTRRVVETVHPLGVDVEAEIGFVGTAGIASDFTDSNKYTDPDEAKRFVEDTGVDCLAVAVGNAHGHYVVDPNLDIDCLRSINKKVDVPLVLHGGSGIPDTQLALAVENGIAKTNFGTDYWKAIYSAELEYVQSEAANKNIFDKLKSGEDGGRSYVEGRILVVSGKKQ